MKIHVVYRNKKGNCADSFRNNKNIAPSFSDVAIFFTLKNFLIGQPHILRPFSFGLMPCLKNAV